MIPISQMKKNKMRSWTKKIKIRMRTMKKMKKKTKKKEKKEIVTPQCLMLIAVLDQATELYYLKSNWMPPH
jgi:hypothetical protein